MARVKRGTVARRRHKKILARAKGYYGARSRVYRVAKQAVIKADQYAYIGRKQKKRNFRSLWITRINAGARMFDLSYSRLINGLSKAGIAVDRKVLADLAVHDIHAFGAVANQARAALGLPPADASKAVSFLAAAAVPAAVVAAVPIAKKAPAKKKAAAGDDLTLVEGIGPKIAELLHGADITSFAELAAADVEQLRSVLQEAGSRFAMHDPATWPQQAGLAAEGKMDELKALQDELKGGRPA